MVLWKRKSFNIKYYRAIYGKIDKYSTNEYIAYNPDQFEPKLTSKLRIDILNSDKYILMYNIEIY